MKITVGAGPTHQPKPSTLPAQETLCLVAWTVTFQDTERGLKPSQESVRDWEERVPGEGTWGQGHYGLPSEEERAAEAAD